MKTFDEFTEDKLNEGTDIQASYTGFTVQGDYTGLKVRQSDNNRIVYVSSDVEKMIHDEISIDYIASNNLNRNRDFDEVTKDYEKVAAKYAKKANKLVQSWDKATKSLIDEYIKDLKKIGQ